MSFIVPKSLTAREGGAENRGSDSTDGRIAEG
jgi:hypothetical protein